MASVPTNRPRQGDGARVLRVLHRGDPSDELVVLALPWGEPELPDYLTGAQADVARLIALGLSNREIADRRECSPRTVANHVAAILQKLGADNRSEIIARISPG
ncbi:MAG: helix-turn-helix transcriptional regulator [Myxococcales bacterium]|nr:helix-turn-helix transcriptional regulator [Myxococcales bacterium]